MPILDYWLVEQQTGGTESKGGGVQFPDTSIDFLRLFREEEVCCASFFWEREEKKINKYIIKRRKGKRNMS